MPARHFIGIIALLSISQLTVLPQEPTDSLATNAALSAAHANSTEGLKEVLLEMRAAARDGNQARFAVMVKQTEIPNCDVWLHKMYASDKADSWMGLCDSKALDISQTAMSELFKKVANENGQFLIRSVNDNPQPGKGFEWGWLQSIRQPLDIYWASWLPASQPDESRAEAIGYFMFIERGFRWDSNIFAKILPAPLTVVAVPTAGKLDQRIEGQPTQTVLLTSLLQCLLTGTSQMPWQRQHPALSEQWQPRAE